MTKKLINGMLSSVSEAELMINAIGDEFLEIPDSLDKVTDKFSDNAGDNALSRAEINASIVSKATANDLEYENELKKGIPSKDEIK